MATLAHCAYCFESLSSYFENRQAHPLAQVQKLWEEYSNQKKGTTTGEAVGTPATQANAALRAVEDGTTSASTPASSISESSTPGAVSSNTSSMSSLRSTLKQESHPLFITWNTVSKSGHKSLRGCIGTFQPQPLSSGLLEYARTSAFEDHRFEPIPASLMPSLQVCVTLLTNFSEPDADPLNWTIGEHGIRLSFQDKGRRYGATYLPDVAKEQGWTKEEAIVSLMRKAGWSGRKDQWHKVAGLEIVRYEGKKVSMDYAEWNEWRSWIKTKFSADRGH